MEAATTSAHVCTAPAASLRATTISFTVDEGNLPAYTDQHLATLWHIAQANPAPFGDRTACAFAEHVGREIISRWLRSVPPELWAHQGRHAMAAHQQAEQPTLFERVKALLAPGEDLTSEEIVEHLGLPLSVQMESKLYAALKEAGAKHLKRRHGNLRRWVWTLNPDGPAADRPQDRCAPLSAPGRPLSPLPESHPREQSVGHPLPDSPQPIERPDQTAPRQSNDVGSRANLPVDGKQTVIFSAPQGWGKSAKAKALLEKFGCSAVIDGWQPGCPVYPGMLHLTNAAPDQITVPSDCMVVLYG